MKCAFGAKGLSYFVSIVIMVLFIAGITFGVFGTSMTAYAAATTLDVSSFDYNTTTSGSGWYYNSSNGTLSVDFGYELTVTGGTFTKKVINRGTILGGVFSGAVTNAEDATIASGTFSATVTNETFASITGGTFTNTSTVNNAPKASITGGSFSGTINNRSHNGGDPRGTISGGTFKDGAKIYNDGELTGGTFEEGSKVYNNGIIDSNVSLPAGTLECAGAHTEKTPATCSKQAVCSVCGQSYGELKPHTFTSSLCTVCSTPAKITYTFGSSTYYTDDISEAVDDINTFGSGTITLNDHVTYGGNSDLVVEADLQLNLGSYKMDLGTQTLVFNGHLTAAIVGTGTIKSSYDTMISGSGEALYVANGATLTIGSQNGIGPTIDAGVNAITSSNNAANKLTIYAGTFHGNCHLSTEGDFNVNIKGGTFKGTVYANRCIIDGGRFEDNIHCTIGSYLIINDCECEKQLQVGENNNSSKKVTLNGGVFKLGIENMTQDGKTTSYLGTDRYYISQDGQVIEIDTASDVGCDLNQYVIVAPIRTVTFETNNYGGEDFTKKVASGFCVDKPSSLTDKKAIFNGWYKDAAFTTEWNFENDKVTDNITLYAKWTPIPQVAAPVFDPVSGTKFEDKLAVSITCETDGATIYYTLDGTEPTTSSVKYTGAIEVLQTQTIKAIAVKDGMLDSIVSTANYTKENKETTPSDSDEDVEDDADDETSDEEDEEDATSDDKESKKDSTPGTGDVRIYYIWMSMLGALVIMAGVATSEKRAKKKS